MSQNQECERSFICVLGYHLCICFYDLSIRFWNCIESVAFYVFHFVYKLKTHMRLFTDHNDTATKL